MIINPIALATKGFVGNDQNVTLATKGFIDIDAAPSRPQHVGGYGGLAFDPHLESDLIMIMNMFLHMRNQ